jgi:hypothetical protein
MLMTRVIKIVGIPFASDHSVLSDTPLNLLL